MSPFFPTIKSSWQNLCEHLNEEVSVSVRFLLIVLVVGIAIGIAIITVTEDTRPHLNRLNSLADITSNTEEVGALGDKGKVYRFTDPKDNAQTFFVLYDK